MEKEYGKLTEDQFKRLIRKLPEIRAGKQDMEDAFRAASPEKLRELLGDGIWWAPVYEFPFAIRLGLLVYLLGLGEKIAGDANAEDPQEAVLEELDSNEEIKLPEGPEVELRTTFGIALVRRCQTGRCDSTAIYTVHTGRVGGSLFHLG